MRDFLLYLAGPITGLSYGESTDWRKYVQDNLPDYIRGVSPMRGKDYLKGQDAIKANYEELPLSSQSGIVTRDRMDVMRSDMVLVNFLGVEKVSIGSVIEIGWADAFRKPIILIMEKEGNVHSHPMIRGLSGYVVHEMDTAISIAIAVLSPTL